MESTAIIALAAAIAVAVSVAFAAMAQGRFATAAMEAMGRQPEAAKDIRGSLLIPLALMEALAIYGMLVAILLVGKI
ncbi:MAG: ATP synthase F0 subunit C [Ruminococcaceae bacterium]|jgi:F-type H+-transporting ATPase subunit c|nr:ATP synthase F0 subunit C [Oscillospiraceae bacterium]